MSELTQLGVEVVVTSNWDDFMESRVGFYDITCGIRTIQ
jgi:hypothetical protein